MKKVVFDIETRNVFDDVASSDPAKLDISVVCIYDYDTNEYSSYEQKDLPKLWPILEKTDLLIGYNSDHFDIPLLQKYCPQDLSKIKSLDLLKEIRKSINRRVKMDQVAEGTLGTKKSGHGLQAVIWWKQGEIEKIIKYCLDDVKITKEIYESALKNKCLKFAESGKMNDIKLNVKDWNKIPEKAAMTFTLPF